MSLTDTEKALLGAAGRSPDATLRQQAVAVVLSQHGRDLDEARDLLARGYVIATQPSFHLIPKGDAMASPVKPDP